MAAGTRDKPGKDSEKSKKEEKKRILVEKLKHQGCTTRGVKKRKFFLF